MTITESLEAAYKFVTPIPGESTPTQPQASEPVEPRRGSERRSVRSSGTIFSEWQLPDSPRPIRDVVRRVR